MFEADQYELIDFGGGRKLERFGAYTLDRPCPAAGGRKRHPAAWSAAQAVFAASTEDRGSWQPKDFVQTRWQIGHGAVRFELKPTAFGHLGVFPEQAANWDWLRQVVASASSTPRVLNLFAYTGGSTLTAAAAGAEVVHVDAARNIVQWASANADHSSLSDAPIRWIVDDATKFVAREVRRGRYYDGIILDPPSYGHGIKGEAWKLTRDLPRLLELCCELASPPSFILLTCHTEGYEPADLMSLVSRTVLRGVSGSIHAGRLETSTSDGRRLDAGMVVRWVR